MSDTVISEKRCKVFGSDSEKRSHHESYVKKHACKHPHCRRKKPPVQFSRPSDLRRHQTTHTNEERICPYCQARLNGRIDNFKRHVKTQHKGGIPSFLYSGDEETVAWFLENCPGCCNALLIDDVYGVSTPPGYAAQSGRVNMVQIFLDRGVDVNAKDQDGGTALHRAARGLWSVSFTKERLEVLKLLLDKGANRQVLTRRGQTAFDLAHSQQKWETMPNPFLLEAIELLRPEVVNQQQAETSPFETR